MRIGLTVLIALHGAIHLLGFVHWSKIAAISGLGAPTLIRLSSGGARAFGVSWLLAGLAFFGAAALRLSRHDGWWVLAVGGVALSQALVVVAWHDARFGSVANLLILVAAVVAALQARFEHRVDDEVRALFSRQAPSPPSYVRADDLAALPGPVARWLTASGVVGRARARSVRLKQRGSLRTSPDGAWMPAEAVQYFTIDEPAFVWRVETSMMGILPVVGRDRYSAGSGRMSIKAASLVSIVEVSDQKIAHGAMLRFLGELVWFPSAALSPYIRWEPIDATSAEATMRHGGLTASAVFDFSEEGRVLGIRAERYLGGGADAKLTPWSVTCTAWRASHGVEVPIRGEVLWNLEGGDFSYYRWEILEVEYDRSEPYGERSSNTGLTLGSSAPA